MGSTRWQYAGLSLILDDPRPQQGRATADITRWNTPPLTRRGLMPRGADSSTRKDVTISNR